MPDNSMHSSEVVDTWEGALALLDRYPWHLLFPLKVHPDFKQQVIDLVRGRYEAGNVPEPDSRLEKWSRVCSAVNRPGASRRSEALN